MIPAESRGRTQSREYFCTRQSLNQFGNSDCHRIPQRQTSLSRFVAPHQLGAAWICTPKKRNCLNLRKEKNLLNENQFVRVRPPVHPSRGPGATGATCSAEFLFRRCHRNVAVLHLVLVLVCFCLEPTLWIVVVIVAAVQCNFWIFWKKRNSLKTLVKISIHIILI